MLEACQTPLPLKSGDLLRVIAPSGRLRDLTAFDRGIAIWRDRGYRVEVAAEVTQAWGYLAGTDVTRRSQLADAWADPECRAILCARGGYGGMRLLEDWQWPQIDRPKWLIGFSDITALLWSLTHQGIAGIHGPLITTLADEPDWSRDRLFSLVTGQPIPPLQGDSWVGNVATGRLFPCNLTVATHLLGTPLQPNLTGAILAIEDVTEAPYRIDRLLTHWRLTGALSKLAGIAKRCVDLLHARIHQGHGSNRAGFAGSVGQQLGGGYRFHRKISGRQSQRLHTRTYRRNFAYALP